MGTLKSCLSKRRPRRVVITEENDCLSKDERIKSKKRVFFAFVQIREHCRILGDHPSVSSGPPISLSWEVESDEMFSIDMYESHRDHYRRMRHEFIVPASIRTEWLLDAGYTMRTIYEASQAIMDARCKSCSCATKTQLRVKADDFAENFKKTMDWALGKNNSVKNSFNEAEDESQDTHKLPLRRSSSTGDEAQGPPARKQLLRRRSSAFL